MRPLLYDLELAFNPGMADITWVSSEISNFCEQVETKLIKVGCFIKEVSNKKKKTLKIHKIIKQIFATFNLGS